MPEREGASGLGGRLCRYRENDFTTRRHLLQLLIHAVQCAAAELHGRPRSAHDGPLDAERRSEAHDRGGGETGENGAQHLAEEE